MRKRYYWLKLKESFFKRHDIKIIEHMENGKDYVLFYLKLMLESIDHIGELRFSDTIPYDAKMLSIITNTNQDTVNCAIEVFKKLNMVEILSNGTIYLKEVEKLLGSECGSAERVRLHRKKNKMLHCNAPVTKCNGDIDIDIDIDSTTTSTSTNKKTDKSGETTFSTRKKQEEAVSIWNESMPWKIRTLTKDRKKKLSARLKEKEFVQNYDTILTKILNSPFLSGKKPSKDYPNFRADFDFIIKNETNYIKILEGKYDR